MYKIYFDYNTESVSSSPELWYVNACEIIITLQTIETSLSEVASVRQIPSIKLEQKYVNIDLHVRDVLGSLSKIYMYLAGIAFENLLKCIILHQHPDKLNEITKGHNLTNLFELANIIITNKDKDFIKRLEVYVIWAGRYPHPKVKLIKGHEIGRVAFSDHDIVIVTNWINKLNAMANHSVWLQKHAQAVEPIA